MKENSKMCHPNSNEIKKRDDVLTANQQEIIGTPFENPEQHDITALPLIRDDLNRLETLERSENDGSQLELIPTVYSDEITNVISNITANQWQELNQAIISMPNNRRYFHNFTQNHSTHRLSLRHKRRFLRRQECKSVNHTLNKMNKLLRKTVRRVKHIRLLMHQQVELVKHLQDVSPNSETVPRFNL